MKKRERTELLWFLMTVVFFITLVLFSIFSHFLTQPQSCTQSPQALWPAVDLSGFSPGDQLLAKEPKDSRYKIDTT